MSTLQPKMVTVKLSAITRRNMTRIIPFGVIWLVFASLFLWVEYAAIGDLENTPESAIKIDSGILVFALIGITCIGLFVGFVEVLFLKRLFEKKSFSIKIVSKFIIYALFFFALIFIMYPIAASFELDTSIFDPRVWNKYFNFFFSLTHLSTAVQLTVSLLASLFYAEISENLGQNVLLNFFTGKYHRPVSETRIFMFADMKSSTTIAENLEHIKYFNLLQSYYYDFTNAIIKNYGEVYQYIGDEIVISWKLKSGLRNNNCVHCFFDMKADLLKRKPYYLKTYGLFPDFKAALHVGEVTVGEIGALKKEIFFTGDVLNTTARMQGLCTRFKEDLLISSDLYKRLKLKSDYDYKMLGNTKLKGKVTTIELLGVRKI